MSGDKEIYLRRSERNQIAKPIAKLLRKEGGVEPKLEFRFKGGLRFDILGYNRQERVLHLVECKAGRGLVRLGKTFGQIIAYIQLVSNGGREFVNRVHDDLRWFTLQEAENMLSNKKVPMRFYVAFREKDAKRDMPFLEWTHRQFLNRKIGVILVDNGKPKVLHEAEIIEVPIKKTYTSIKHFFNELKEKVNHDPQIVPDDIKLNRQENRYLQFIYGHPSFHFEVWFRRPRKEIEVGLHLEASKQKNRKILRELRKKKARIKDRLPNIVMGRFGKSLSWKKATEAIPWSGKLSELDEEILSEVYSLLRNYIITLKPILDSIDWGEI